MTPPLPHLGVSMNGSKWSFHQKEKKIMQFTIRLFMPQKDGSYFVQMFCLFHEFCQEEIFYFSLFMTIHAKQHSVTAF